MGGNAFTTYKVDRINREDIIPTVSFIVDELAVDGFTLDYACNNLLGSSGKQATSGDLDIAMNTVGARFVGQDDVHVFNVNSFTERLTEVIGDRAKTKLIRSGNIPTVWPIKGNSENGFVQVDFLFGNSNFLKFSTYSPGEISKFKGRYINMALMSLAKTRIDFIDHFDNGKIRSRVNLHYNMNEGLFRAFNKARDPSQNLSRITQYEFELMNPELPRFCDFGLIDDPDEIVRILLGDGFSASSVETLEQVFPLIVDACVNLELFMYNFEYSVRTAASKDLEEYNSVMDFVKEQVCLKQQKGSHSSSNVQ